MLRGKLNALEAALLPAKQDPSGNYPPEQEIRTRAYLVLAHAAFEKFLEDACRSAVATAQLKLDQGEYSSVALSLNSFYSTEPNPTPETFLTASASQKKRLEWRSRSESAFVVYHETLDSNNGIKQYNLVRLLGPLGLDLGALSSAMLLECDKFGDVRGKLAHGKAQQVVDPFSEKRKVDDLEKFFGELAATLAALP